MSDPEPSHDKPQPDKPGRRDGAKEAAALALAKGLTGAAAARVAGVSTRTMTRWRSEESFADRVADLRLELTDRAVGVLAATMSRAASKLRDLLTDPDPNIALRAADKILAHGLRVNLDLEDLRKQVAELQKKFEQNPTSYRITA